MKSPTEGKNSHEQHRCTQGWQDGGAGLTKCCRAFLSLNQKAEDDRRRETSADAEEKKQRKMKGQRRKKGMSVWWWIERGRDPTSRLEWMTEMMLENEFTDREPSDDDQSAVPCPGKRLKTMETALSSHGSSARLVCSGGIDGNE